MSKAYGVIPPTPIINRRTGKATKFGVRRAFDGFYVLELLNATGCTAEEAATVRMVLEPLLANCGEITVAALLNSLKIYFPYELEEPKPHLTIVE
jgi:hypothetical protein